MKNPIIKLFVLLLLISPAIAQDELPDVAWTIGQDEPIGMFAEVFFHPDGNSFFARNIIDVTIEQRSSEDGSLMNTISFKDLETEYELRWCDKSESGNYILVIFKGNQRKITKIIDVNTLEIIKSLEDSISPTKNYYISPDDRYLYAIDDGASTPMSDYNNMVFVVMDFKTEEILYQVQAKDYGIGVSNIALAPNNEDIILERVHYYDNGNNAYFTLDKMKVGKWQIEKSITIDKPAKQLKFSFDGKNLFFVNRYGFDIYDFESLEISKKFVIDDDVYKINNYTIFSKNTNNSLMRNGTDREPYSSRLDVFDFNENKIIRHYYFPVTGFDLSYDDKKIISRMNKGFIMLNAKWTTGVVSVEEPLKPLEFNIIPNPAESKCTVELNLLDAGDLSIRITGIDGAKVKDFGTKWYDVGDLSILLDISDIPSGMYLVNIEMNNQSYSEKLIVVN